MDPVSRVLVEREQSRGRLLPWVVVAVLLHAGAAAATYIVGKRAAARPVQLPAVSVRVVRPESPSRRPSSSGPRSQPTAVPAATRAPATPVPQPTAAATAVPTARPRQEASPPASADAMGTADSKATPVPTPEAVGRGAQGGSGLSVGAETGGSAPGIPSDFHFTYYVKRMLALIESRWYKPAAASGTRTQVAFTILKDGRLEGIRLEQSSGLPSFDRAALRAIYAANPLPPLPPAYNKPSLTVHLSFTE